MFTLKDQKSLAPHVQVEQLGGHGSEGMLSLQTDKLRLQKCIMQTNIAKDWNFYNSGS